MSRTECLPNASLVPAGNCRCTCRSCWVLAMFVSLVDVFRGTGSHCNHFLDSVTLWDRGLCRLFWARLVRMAIISSILSFLVLVDFGGKFISVTSPGLEERVEPSGDSERSHASAKYVEDDDDSSSSLRFGNREGLRLGRLLRALFTSGASAFTLMNLAQSLKPGSCSCRCRSAASCSSATAFRRSKSASPALGSCEDSASSLWSMHRRTSASLCVSS